MAKYVAGTVAEIARGTCKIVEIAGRSIGIYNLDGEFFALRNRCPHQGGPLCAGRRSGLVTAEIPGKYIYTRPGEIVRCPWHGWEFDIRTGQSWYDPAHVRVRRYDVTIEIAPQDQPVSTKSDPTAEDRDPFTGLAHGPYVAEIYPVSIEQQQVVIEVPGA